MLRRLLKSKKGAALVEYALLVGGVALIGAASVAIFGHKTNDLVAAVAAVLPGAHADDNGPIASGKIIETVSAEDGLIAIDFETVLANSETSRLGNNLGTTAIEDLVVEVP